MNALSDTGWQPLKGPRVGAESFAVTPFMRLARTHAASVAGDTLMALALAGSLFFSISPGQARDKVALYLILTMAPFSLVAPLIGPWLDRIQGGRRWVLVGANAFRAGLAVLMIGHLDSLLLFPEAFTVLVLSKSYQVAKSALVPTTVVSDDELVEANSRLSLLSAVMGFVAVVPGGLAVWLVGSQGPLVLAAGGFVGAALLATQIPATRIANAPESTLERDELRSAGILLAASAMALLRGIVGFLTFLLAFEFRGEDETWMLGVAVACSAIGSLSGAVAAPALRRADMSEERILQLFLGVIAAAGLVTAYVGGIVGAALLAGTVGLAASAGKLAFDAVVQRDAPDANRGRSFARFETRFQLIWVAGAFAPVAVHIPARLGFVIIAGGAAFALLSYMAGSRAVARGQPVPRRTVDTRKLLRRSLEARNTRRTRRHERAAANAVPAALAMTPTGSARSGRSPGSGSSDGDAASVADPTGVSAASGSSGRSNGAPAPNQVRPPPPPAPPADPTSPTETAPAPGGAAARPPPPPPPPPPPSYRPPADEPRDHRHEQATGAPGDDDTTIVIDPTKLF